MRLSCIGIGSNAIRLLTAEWRAGQLVTIRRERCGTRLFAGLVNGALTEQSMQASVDAVALLTAMAREDGAQALYIFATSAVRDAANGADFTARCEGVCGSPVEIVTGREEAILSYIGASDGGSCGVVDIGGGSTEFTLGDGAQVLEAVSLQLGAVRMHAQKPIASLADYEQELAHCETVIRAGASSLLAAPARAAWVGVGGTMTTLGAMQRGIPLFTPDACEGMTMQREEVAHWGRYLSGMPLEARRQVKGLMPHRADIMPHGIAILEAAMRCFDVPVLRLSAHGNMDGYLKKKFSERA